MQKRNELAAGISPTEREYDTQPWWRAQWVRLARRAREKRVVILIGALVLCLTGLPYLAAVKLANGGAGGGNVFTGFLFNPQDGASYLAKMYQGWRGDWRFTLPYTADPGNGAYLFLFYLALGHLAQGLNLSLILAFHAARIAGVVLLMFSLDNFLAAWVPEERHRNLAFALAALGSGLGWLAALFGGFTADFWVAEAYPFLSAYATPHFVIGLALLLWLLTPVKLRSPWLRVVLRAAAGLILAVISPFGVVIAVLVTGALAMWERIRPNPTPGDTLPVGTSFRLYASDCLSILLGGAPLLVYDVWVASRDPVLSGWNAQNLTLSPPVWNIVVALSPALLLALLGLPAAWRANQAGTRLWVAWAGLGLLLLYLPFGLQRRFVMGIYIPLAVLAVYGVVALARGSRRRASFLVAGLFLLSLPTNLLVLMTAVHGINTQDPQFYLSSGEARAMTWLAENTPPDALVLAAPDTGLLIPALTGRRVIYGHPYETVDADNARSLVTGFYLSGGNNRSLLATHQVDYVWYGPRERRLGALQEIPDLQEVFTSSGVTIYATGQ